MFVRKNYGTFFASDLAIFDNYIKIHTNAIDFIMMN